MAAAVNSKATCSSRPPRGERPESGERNAREGHAPGGAMPSWPDASSETVNICAASTMNRDPSTCSLQARPESISSGTDHLAASRRLVPQLRFRVVGDVTVSQAVSINHLQ